MPRGCSSPWRSAIDELADLLAPRRHVALVVSCRSPFEHHALSDAVLSQMEKIIHRGFDEQEFDAQAEFFRYCKVPLPEVPPLDDEFSRPLTLKLICESFRGLGTKKLKEGYLRRSLGKTRQTFVWCNWGERGWADKGDLRSHPSPERSAMFQTHVHIHRRFHEYE